MHMNNEHIQKLQFCMDNKTFITWTCKYVSDTIYPLSHNAGIVTVKHNMALAQLVAACTTHVIERKWCRGANGWQFNITTRRLEMWCNLTLCASRTNSNNISQLHQLIFCLCFRNTWHIQTFIWQAKMPTPTGNITISGLSKYIPTYTHKYIHVFVFCAVTEWLDW